MKWTILTICFLCFLGNELIAQNGEELKEHIDHTMVTTQVEDIPVLTDIIVVPTDEKDVIYPAINVINNSISLQELVRPIQVQDAIGGNSGNWDTMGEFNDSDDYSQSEEGNNDHYCRELSVYPNPATDYTNLIVPTKEEYNVYLFDLAGNERAYWKIIEQTETRLDLANLPVGIYLLQVICADEIKTLRLKIVK